MKCGSCKGSGKRLWARGRNAKCPGCDGTGYKSVTRRKYRALLSNHTDRRDDESFDVWATSQTEAQTKVAQRGWDRSRFSLRGVYLASELR